VFEGRVLVPGEARGKLLLLEEPLSFWGGVDPRSGDIIDRHHPQVGRSVTGAIVAMPSGRGSSSSSSVLAESIRAGTGPAGILLAEDDRIVALGALVAAELYGASVPVVVCKAEDLTMLESGRETWMRGATVSVEEPQPG
jgi:uncharacterized protein